MLLVDGDEAEARELDLVFDKRVRADDELGFAGADAFERGCFFCALEAADEEFDAITAGSQNAARGKIMLHGENFRGRHERGLAAVFDGDDGGLERDDGLAAADVALQEAIHRGGLFEVGGNFAKTRFCAAVGLKGKDALDGFADFFFADAEGDGVFLARGFAVEREAELVEKKFFEDEALLRRSERNVLSASSDSSGARKMTWIKASRREGIAEIARAIVPGRLPACSNRGAGRAAYIARRIEREPNVPMAS